MPKRSRSSVKSAPRWRRRWARKSFMPIKRNPYRNAYSYSRVPTQLSTVSPFPLRNFATLKYSDVIQVSGSAGVGVDWLFNLNSIFDPDRTGTGHQPYGHDQLNAIYNRYRVWACNYKITVPIKNNGNSANLVTVIPSNQATSLVSTALQAPEIPGAKSTVMGVVPQEVGNVLRGRVYLPTLTGQSRVEYAGEAENDALFGASPSQLCVLHVVVAPVVSTESVLAFINVELTYEVEVWDQNQLAQS